MGPFHAQGTAATTELSRFSPRAERREVALAIFAPPDFDLLQLSTEELLAMRMSTLATTDFWGEGGLVRWPTDQARRDLPRDLESLLKLQGLLMSANPGGPSQTNDADQGDRRFAVRSVTLSGGNDRDGMASPGSSRSCSPADLPKVRMPCCSSRSSPDRAMQVEENLPLATPAGKARSRARLPAACVRTARGLTPLPDSTDSPLNHGYHKMNLRIRSAVFAFSFLLAVVTAQSPPLGQNLITNGDFESGLAGWAVTPANGVTAEPYGLGVNTPSPLVALVVGGGAALASDTTGNGRLRQTISIVGLAASVDTNQLAVRAEGLFGGFVTDSDTAELVIQFLDGLGLPTGGGSPVGVRRIGGITNSQRNRETVVIRRGETFPIPVLTRSFHVDVQFATAGGSQHDGCADNIHVSLIAQGPRPPLPLETDLVSNGGFENGWDNAFAGPNYSPLTLHDSGGFSQSGWIGAQGQSSVTVQQYGASSSVPIFEASIAIGGGDKLLRDLGGNGTLVQEFDLRGNLAAILSGQLSVKLTGCFGGQTGDPDRSDARLQFFNQAGNSITITPVIGSYQPFQRNQETVLLATERTYSIPTSAARMVLILSMTNVSGIPDGAADNISLKLTASATPPGVALNLELLANSDFEQGWLPQTPLTLRNPNASNFPQNPTGWVPGSSATITPELYGSAANVPSFGLGTAIGGGSRVASDLSGNARIEQVIDIRGNAQQVQSGSVSLRLSGLFGGITTDSDSCGMRAQYVTANDVLIGATDFIGNFSPADRNRESVMIRDTKTFAIPSGTARIVVSLEMLFNSGTADGCCDNLSAMLVPTQAPVALPLMTELLANSGFENGWQPVSPLQLQTQTGLNPSGWRGIGNGSSTAEQYGMNGAPFPGLAGGGLRILGDTTGNAGVMQSFDLRGNAALVSSGVMQLQLSGYLGSRPGDPDTARIQVSYYGNNVLLQPPSVLGPFAGTIAFRQMTDTVPTAADRMVVEVLFTVVSGPPDGFADNVSAVLFNSLLGGASPRPGTNEDLVLLTAVGNALPTTGASNEIKLATTGDSFTVVLHSLNGTFAGAVPLLVMSAKPTPTVVSSCTGCQVPGIQILLQDLIVIHNGFVGIPPFSPQPLPANGMTFVFTVPPGFIGQSFIFQGAAVTVTPPLAANGSYASTNAHEIRVL